MRLADLKSRARNPRTHDERNVAAIAASIRKFGQVEPLLVERGTLTLIAGHGRLEGLRAAGVETADVLEVDVHGLEADDLALRLNRTAELAGWERGELAELVRDLEASGEDLVDIGFLDDEVSELVKSLDDEGSSTPAARETPDEVEPKQVAKRAELGTTWALGPHRVLCADSLDLLDEAKGQPKANLVAELLGETKAAAVVTDPPYAIFGSSTGVESDVADDRMVRPFCKSVLELASRSVRTFGHVYVFCDWRSWAAWFDGARGFLTPANLLVWDKGDFGLGANYRNNYELVGFFHKRPKRIALSKRRQAGTRTVNEPNIIRHARTGQAGFEREVEKGERFHNAAKPIGVLRGLIANSSDAGELILDPFAGSGSTLLACELEGRTCYSVDIDPQIVDVMLARWEAATGKGVERVD